MRNLVVKIKEAIKQIESEKGDFTLKCLVSKNSDSDMKWDLILSAKWFDETSEIECLNYLAGKIFADFNTSDLFDFSTIIAYKTTESNSLIDCLRDVIQRVTTRKSIDSGNYGDDVQYSLSECRGFERECVIVL